MDPVLDRVVIEREQYIDVVGYILLVTTLSRFQPGREVLVGKGCGSQVDVCRSVGVTMR